MHFNNPRRPGRTDHSPSHRGPMGSHFEPLEQLEPRVYADAAPFPSTATEMFATAGTYSTLDGGAAPLPSADWDNGHTLMGLTQMWADPRFSAFRGTGMRTVLLDTGINLGSPFFGPDADGNGVADRIVYQYDFAENDGNATDTMGHGSNVASAVASSNGTYGGVAPNADIIALRVFNNAGQGSFQWLERGLQWVVANAVQYNIASVNMSLGDGRYWTSNVRLYNIGDELATLASMGVIVTAAAGNGFYDGGSRTGLSYPAADPNVIAVGAVYGQDGGGFGYSGGAIATTSPAGTLTPFTQRSPLLTILAPGAPIVGAAAGGGVSVMHGTSQASPQIAGLALLAQEMSMTMLGRRLSVTEFRTIITTSATTVIDGDDENDNVANTGASYPLVNALAMAEAIWGMRTIAAQQIDNTPPVLSGVQPLTGALISRSAVIDYATLARAADVSDAEGGRTLFRVDKVLSGTLTINGRAFTSETVFGPGDTMVWTPVAGDEGDLSAISIRAFDGIDSSVDNVEVVVNVARTSDPAFDRGIRLVSDLPTAGASPSRAFVAAANGVRDELPTVADLTFLDFHSSSRVVAGNARLAADLFAGASMKIAA
ncbi:MAG: S8 family serine peptidase [Phycisphaerales bacterium]|nr:S8 family serine peptidase [Phycisphaerales bacterium]